MTERSIKHPLVSVIMPVYNCAQYVDEAIGSMVNQTYKNMEIFIIDDCSTDGTKEKVDSWAKLDERIKPVYKSVNTGYVESLNMAIGLSNGEYIARMDGDDISLPERIERQVEFMQENHSVGVLGTGYKQVHSSRYFIPTTNSDEIKVGLLFQNQLAHPTVIIRRETLIKLGRGYSNAFLPCEDFELWTELIKITEIINLEQHLLEYRVHSGSTSRKSDNSLLLKKILKKNLSILTNDLNSEFIDLVYELVYNGKLKASQQVRVCDIHTFFLLINENEKKNIWDTKKFKEIIEYFIVLTISKHGKKRYLRNNFRFLKNELHLLMLVLWNYNRPKIINWNYVDIKKNKL